MLHKHSGDVDKSEIS